MTLGDILEVIAIAAFVVAAILAFGVAAGFAVLGGGVFYLAQIYGGQFADLLHVLRWKPRREKSDT